MSTTYRVTLVDSITASAWEDSILRWDSPIIEATDSEGEGVEIVTSRPSDLELALDADDRVTKYAITSRTWKLIEEAYHYDTIEAETIEEAIDDQDHWVSEKWGPAGCVPVSPGKWLFFGWAAT